MVIHCYILNTFWYNNVFSQSAPSGPIEPPKFNQGLKSFNKDISRTVGQILKIRPHSRLQVQFSITFILCQCTIFLLLRDKNYKKLFLNDPWADTDPTFLGPPGPSMNHIGKFNSSYNIYFMQINHISTCYGLELKKNYFWTILGPGRSGSKSCFLA